MPAADFLLYVLSSLTMLCVFASILNTSECGVVIAGLELIFILGVCVFPPVFALGLLMPLREGKAYLDAHPIPSTATAIHVFLFALGAICGVAFAKKHQLSTNTLRRVVKMSRICAPNMKYWWALLIAAGIGYVTFIVLVGGISVALGNAAAARSGVFEGFGSGVNWLFLKTFSLALLTLVSCIIPYALVNKSRTKLFLSVYLAVVALAFLNAISRTMILMFLIAPFVTYALRGHHKVRLSNLGVLLKPRHVVVIALVAVLGGSFLYFGKSIGQVSYSYYILGRDETLSSDSRTSASLGAALMDNSAFMWFSTAAGISHSYYDSPLLIPKDVLLSPLGFIPTRVMNAVGKGELSPQNVSVDKRLACINTLAFPGQVSCTVPPGWIGYSAYFLPFVGALLFGFVKFYLYGRIARVWKEVKAIDYRHTWVAFLATLAVGGMTSVIPSSIALVTFVCLLTISWYIFRRLMRRRLERCCTGTE